MVLAGPHGGDPESLPPQAVDSIAVKKTQVDLPRDPTYFGSEARKSVGPPPANYEGIRKAPGNDGIRWVSGNIYVESPADTSLLTSFGFRFTIFGPFETKDWIDSLQTWTQPCYMYMGDWPIDLPWDSLPTRLLRIVYPVIKKDTPQLDQSRPNIHDGEADEQYPVPWPTQGNVIFGIIDTGFDIQHQALRDGSTEHSTLFRAILDYTSSSTNLLPPFNNLELGWEYDEDAINQAMQNPPPALQDPFGHGTSMASIIAGRNTGTFADLSGIASEAPVIGVKYSPDAGVSADAFARLLLYLRAKAHDLGKQYVVTNYSAGHRSGPHNGRDAQEFALNTALNWEDNFQVVSLSASRGGG
ncbi:S8 family serine peptidase [candidate division KSB1 bacterium]|nr:S8 family serine peptidase [candidate division KSB1 bacterium]